MNLQGHYFLCFAFETYITYLQNFLSTSKFTSQNEITTWTLVPYSRAILGYLVEQYAKDDSLYPKNPKKRAVVNQMLYFDATTLYQRTLNYYVSIVQILFKINGSYINTCCILLLLQLTNAQIYITINSNKGLYMQPHKYTAFERFCNVAQTMLYHSATTKWYINLRVLWNCNLKSF